MASSSMSRLRAAPGAPRPRALAAAAFALALVLGGAAAPRGATAVTKDQGTFKIYLGSTALGTEMFSYDVTTDSLVIGAHTRVLAPSTRPDTLVKDVALVVATDYDLRGYRSQETVKDQVLLYGLVVQDTAMTIYRQQGPFGNGTRVARPPGRLFVIDPFVYTMFDVIGRNLHGRSFERREIQLLVLAGQDSVVPAVATRLEPETIPWGGKPVKAERFDVSDSRVTFQLWMSPAGQMIRLLEPRSGLRVEREPPPVKRRSKSGG